MDIRRRIERIVGDTDPSGHVRADHQDEARRDLVDAVAALVAEEVKAARLAPYETLMRELAAEVELVDHDQYDTVVRLERTTYDKLLRYRADLT